MRHEAVEKRVASDGCYNTLREDELVSHTMSAISDWMTIEGSSEGTPHWRKDGRWKKQGLAHTVTHSRLDDRAKGYRLCLYVRVLVWIRLV